MPNCDEGKPYSGRFRDPYDGKGHTTKCRWILSRGTHFCDCKGLPSPVQSAQRTWAWNIAQITNACGVLQSICTRLEHPARFEAIKLDLLERNDFKFKAAGGKPKSEKSIIDVSDEHCPKEGCDCESPVQGMSKWIYLGTTGDGMRDKYRCRVCGVKLLT